MSELHPFSCKFTKSFPDILHELKATIAISTYQAGKVIFLGAVDDKKLFQLPRNFKRPMGIALREDKMAVATIDQVVMFRNEPKLAKSYPTNKDVYDALFLPRQVFFSGTIDAHDLEWCNDELIAVNTRFSCLATFDDNYSFVPIWHPPFISELMPEDRCHLNGLAIVDGSPKYVTALGATDTPDGWRENKLSGGILMDIETNEIILDGLTMPHSPRYFDGELYMLISGRGELVKVDVENKSYEVICELDGFARGMVKHDDFLFIGLSKVRESSKDFAKLPVSEKAKDAGVVIVYLPTKEIAGKLVYVNNVDEIFDVQILPGITRPNILNTNHDMFIRTLVTPDGSFWKSEKK